MASLARELTGNDYLAQVIIYLYFNLPLVKGDPWIEYHQQTVWFGPYIKTNKNNPKTPTLTHCHIFKIGRFHRDF